MEFQPKGPRRYEHQTRILRKIIETKGVCALLADPGTGKSAPTLDYLSMLALKAQESRLSLVDSVPEIRALVVSPKAAVDNWVLQSETYVADGVDVWAEALGGSILEKTQAIASRGPRGAYNRPPTARTPRGGVLTRSRHLNRSELIYSRSGASKLEEMRRDQPRLILLSVNFDAMASRAAHGSGTMADEMVKAVKAFEPHVIVVDESHKIKSNSSNTSRLLARLGRLSQRRLILTGTVMAHSPMDVFGQWRFLEPTVFGDIDPRTGERRQASFETFRNRYGVMGGFMGRQVIAFKNLEDMQERMALNSVVVRKEDALDLPDALDIIVPVVLSPAEQAVYADMKKTLVADLGNETVVSPNRLVQIMRLRQITAGHLPAPGGGVVEIGSSKLEAIASIANDTLEGENRVVVFALFRQEIEDLRRRLVVPGTEVLVIDGRTPPEERLAIRRRFGSKDPKRLILLAQIKTISLSVNELVTASHAIFASLSQQRDDLVQARDRLNRIGQTRKMTFWFPLAKDSIDYTIYRSHENRTNLEQAVLDHVRGLTSERDFATT